MKSAYAQNYPIFVSKLLVQAVAILEFDIKSFDFAQFASNFARDLSETGTQQQLSGTASQIVATYSHFLYGHKTLPNLFETLVARPDYYSTELSAIEVLLQQAQTSGIAAAVKLPKC